MKCSVPLKDPSSTKAQSRKSSCFHAESDPHDDFLVQCRLHADQHLPKDKHHQHYAPAARPRVKEPQPRPHSIAVPPSRMQTGLAKTEVRDFSDASTPRQRPVSMAIPPQASEKEDAVPSQRRSTKRRPWSMAFPAQFSSKPDDKAGQRRTTAPRPKSLLLERLSRKISVKRAPVTVQEEDTGSSRTSEDSLPKPAQPTPRRRRIGDEAKRLSARLSAHADDLFHMNKHYGHALDNEDAQPTPRRRRIGDEAKRLSARLSAHADDLFQTMGTHSIYGHPVNMSSAQVAF